MPYDALLLVSFGGPAGPDDVLPFLRNVTRGRDVPDARLAAVAEHYARFGGVSPINQQNRDLLAAVRDRVEIPVYWGNRNWDPYLAGALAQMSTDGVCRALAFVTSAYGSYSGCRQYREDIERARGAVADAPVVDKLRVFYNHPLFIAPFVRATNAAIMALPPDVRDEAALVFTAHSVPTAMASRAPYVAQVRAAAALVANNVGGDRSTSVAWQSRSGRAQVPWLEPDVSQQLDTLRAGGRTSAVVVPIGFVSDHMEVAYDLDVVAIPAAAASGLVAVRAETPGIDLAPLVAALVGERQTGGTRAFLGTRGPSHDGCPATCCLPS